MNDIDEIIDDFDYKGRVNKTQKEDLYPNIQNHIVIPVPSAPPRNDDDDYYPRKNSLDDSYMC